jgi:MFS family permease
MNWLWLVSYFFGGVFAANAIPSLCRRHHGTPLSESLRKTARQRALLFNGQRCLGILQRGGRVSARRARRCFRSAGDKPHPCVRPGRAAHQHLFGASLRPVPWGQHAVAPMKNPVSGTFRSLRSFNFRLWTAGALISNVGTWMQRVAQDWLVLTQLTHHDASALGIVMGLQFAPQLLLLPWTGSAADRLNQRKLLMLTQATMGVLALILGVLTIAGVIRLWHVYVFAFLSGSGAALDAPVRQTFVAEMVGDEDLPNAVALNSTSFNAAQMIGPAVAGLLIANVGIGWAFLLNGLSFAAVLISMSFFRLSELRASVRAHRTTSGFLEGLRYVWRGPDLRAILVMLFLIGTFGLNFPIFISTMAVNVFHSDARAFGLLSSIMAVGSLSGALFAAGRKKPGLASLSMGAGVFGLGCTLAALAPGYWWFAAALASAARLP